jgi:hypothetical protein
LLRTTVSCTKVNATNTNATAKIVVFNFHRNSWDDCHDAVDNDVDGDGDNGDDRRGGGDESVGDMDCVEEDDIEKSLAVASVALLSVVMCAIGPSTRSGLAS